MTFKKELEKILFKAFMSPAKISKDGKVEFIGEHPIDKVLSQILRLISEQLPPEDKHWEKGFAGSKKFAMGWNCAIEKMKLKLNE